MSSPTEKLQCELCKSVTATYRPKLNRILCLQHTKELEVKRSIHLYTAQSIENLASEMLRQHQVILSKQKILSIIKTTSDKTLIELDSDF